MYHTAYVAATLTSPKGRVAYYGQISAPSTVRQDVSLPFDPTDLGTYVVTGTHSGFCYTCVCWWFQNMQSEASTLVRMTQYAALRSDTTTTDLCGYTIRQRTYQGLDSYGWIPNNEYWILNETVTSKNSSCGTIVTGGSNGLSVGFTDVIDIGCANPNTCVFETDQTFSVSLVQGQPMTQVPGKDCVQMTDTQCLAQPSHTGWHVKAASSSVTVTDN